MTTSVWDSDKRKNNRYHGHVWGSDRKCDRCHIGEDWILARKRCQPRPSTPKAKKAKEAETLRPKWFDLGAIELNSKTLGTKGETTK